MLKTELAKRLSAVLGELVKPNEIFDRIETADMISVHKNSFTNYYRKGRRLPNCYMTARGVGGKDGFMLFYIGDIKDRKSWANRSRGWPPPSSESDGEFMLRVMGGE